MKRLGAFLLPAAFTMASISAQVLVPTPTAAPAAEATGIPLMVPTGDGQPPLDQEIAGIHMFDAQRGWALLRQSSGIFRVLHTQDGGTSWQDRSAGLQFSYEGASFLDAEHAWVLSWDGADLYRTGDSGRSWTAASTMHAWVQLYDFSSETEGIGTSADSGETQTYWRFYKTQDSGMTWSLVPVQFPGAGILRGRIRTCNLCGDTVSLFQPEGVIITHGDLAGHPRGAVRLSVSFDLGKTWTELMLPLPSSRYRDAFVWPAAPTFFDRSSGLMPVHIFKLGEGTEYAYRVVALYSTKDGGRTWTASAGVAEDVPVFTPETNLLSMTDVIVRCGQELCLTQDAGKSWTTITPNIDMGGDGPSRHLRQLDFVDVKTGWAVAYDNNGRLGLYRTTDGGATWNLLSK